MWRTQIRAYELDLEPEIKILGVRIRLLYNREVCSFVIRTPKNFADNSLIDGIFFTDRT